ncbi:alpha/beta fold hydrolase, partial [Ruegeria sp. HKCCD7318]
AEDMRKMISPENMGRYRGVIDNIDISPILSKVEVPCLVCHGTSDRMQPVEQGRLFAKGLPNAKFIAYESSNHTIPDNDPEWPRFERDALAFLAEHS